MSLPLTIPGDPKLILPGIEEIIRRAVDGTIVPLYVDYQNQRVIIGSIRSKASDSKVQIHNGDLEIIDWTKGVILPDKNGTGRTARLQLSWDVSTQAWVTSITQVADGWILKDAGGSGKLCLFGMGYDTSSQNWYPTYSTIASGYSFTSFLLADTGSSGNTCQIKIYYDSSSDNWYPAFENLGTQVVTDGDFTGGSNAIIFADENGNNKRGKLQVEYSSGNWIPLYDTHT